MKSKHKSFVLNTFLLLEITFSFCVGLILVSPHCLADESVGDTTSTPPESTKILSSQDLDLLQAILKREWESDKALEAKVSFTVEKQPLPNFFSELQKKSGVHLMLPPDSEFAAKLLTARGDNIALKEVMSSLARLYGLTWLKTEEGYEGSALKLNDVERKLITFGDFEAWLSQKESMSGDQRQALAQALVNSSNSELLKSATGQPFTTLPATLQSQVRAAVERQAALRLVNLYSKAMLPSFAESQLEVKSAPATITQRDDRAPKRESKIEKTSPSRSFYLALIDSKSSLLAPIGSVTLSLNRPAN